MHWTHAIFGLLVGICAQQCLARSVHEHRQLSQINEYGSHDISSESRNISQLAIRQQDDLDDAPDNIGCMTLCSAKNSISRRAFTPLDPRNDFSRRALSPYPVVGSDKERDKYIMEACENLQPSEEIVPEWAQQGLGYASAVTSTFGKQAFKFGMRQICGCSMMFVISRKRVYLGHYWEEACFGADRQVVASYRQQVTNFLLSGYQAPGGPPQNSLKQYAADFEVDMGLQVYIYAPDRKENDPPSGKSRYPAKTKTMKETVASALGIDKEKVNVRTYIAVDAGRDNSDALRKTAAGHMLFEFDPSEGRRNSGHSTWRIIWQREIIAADKWDPKLLQSSSTLSTSLTSTSSSSTANFAKPTPR